MPTYTYIQISTYIYIPHLYMYTYIMLEGCKARNSIVVFFIIIVYQLYIYVGICMFALRQHAARSCVYLA